MRQEAERVPTAPWAPTRKAQVTARLLCLLSSTVLSNVYRVLNSTRHLNTAGNGSCTGCPGDDTTLYNARTNQGDCLCNVGYTGPDGGSCDPCPAGTYKNLQGKYGMVLCCFCAVSGSIFQMSRKVLLCNENSAATCESGHGDCIVCDEGKYTDSPGMCRELYCVCCPRHP